MRLSAVTVAVLSFCLHTTAALAQVGQSPYEAVVESDNVQIRSGPGGAYYATGTLSRGDRVTVHRHDPGAWYMIGPPPGSFSWIRAKYVRKLDANRGVLTANNVVVRVGSALEDVLDVEQVRLSTDDLVEIIGEQMLSFDGQPVSMYKIKPPQGEYRWIPGRFVTPVDQIVRRQQDRDPFAVPPSVPRPAPAGPRPKLEQLPPPIAETVPRPSAPEDGFVERPLVRTESRTTPDDQAVQAQRRRLKDLDDRFRVMITTEAKHWNMDELERGYRQLHAEASDPALVAQLEQRFPALEKYKRIKSDYDDLMRLTSETSRRDAQLLSIQRQKAENPARGEQAPVAPPPAAPQPGLNAAPPQRAGPSAPPQTSPGNKPKFDGAGIIQRIRGGRPGAPPHALIAPDGRILAYLRAVQGINLDRYLGQAMGVYGDRSHHPALQTDYIVVRGMTPVRLAR